MKNKKIILLTIGILLGISALVGISYAYYIKSHNQEESNIVKTKCLNFSITNEKNDINLDEQYPILDSEGRKLTPYQFTITNTCEQFISYNVNLESLETTTMDSNAVKVMINNEAPVNLSTLESTSVSIDSSKDSKILATGSLGSGDSVDYALRLWMDYGDSADISSMDKVFESKIVVTATVGTYKPSDYVTTLHDAILVNEYGVTDVNNAINRIEAKGTPDLSQTAPIIKWVEKTGESTTNQVIKPTLGAIAEVPELNGFENAEQYMYICTTKDFDASTAKYLLRDCSLMDPTTLDYTGDNKYYYLSESLAYNNANSKLYVVRYTEGNQIYVIKGAEKTSGTQTINDVTYNANIYNLSCLTLTEEEFETDKSDKGLYKSLDDYGTSYYYRGNVINNNVYFGGYYWQIIRINGNGTIRLIYNGSEKNADGSEKFIGSSSFNGKYNKPAYVGYMYGDDSSSVFSEIHSNVNSSVIKLNIDSWYEKNILNNGYSNYVDNDTGFCGDRALYSGDGVSLDKFTSFMALKRQTDGNPQLTCENISNDFYTITNSSIGNKSLVYPIGLITYDELVFSGMNYEIKNKLVWTYSSAFYWTMTPTNYNASWKNANNWVMSDSGIVYSGGHIGRSYGIRPVINLKADVEISGGIGTANDPYIIKTS